MDHGRGTIHLGAGLHRARPLCPLRDAGDALAGPSDDATPEYPEDAITVELRIQNLCTAYWLGVFKERTAHVFNGS